VVLHVHFDQWPMLVTVVSGKLTDADVDVLTQANASALQRGGPIISMADITLMTAVPTALQRKTYASWRKDHFDALRRNVVAVAFVIGERPLLRGGLTALSWLAPHPSPEGYFAEREEAVAWLRKHLDKTGGTPRSSWRPSIPPRVSSASDAKRPR
jgi:hypothetical protein